MLLLSYSAMLREAGQNLFQLMDVFSGGAFAQMTVIALGVMPYISASIIMQLARGSCSFFAKRDSRKIPMLDGRKMGKVDTLCSLCVLAFFQSGLFAKYALQLNAGNPGIIVS